MKPIIIFLLASFLLLLHSEQLLAEEPLITQYVAPTGTDSGFCTIAEQPCQTIGYVLSKTFDKSEIRVAAGLYSEPIFVDKSIRLIGGFTVTNWLTPTWTTNLTILDGQKSYRPLTIRANQVHVDGFVVQNGNATFSDHVGGGIFIGSVNQVMEATLRNLRIENNIASTVDDGEGGGIAAQMGDSFQQFAKLKLENVALISNTATIGHLAAMGGGMSLQAVGMSQLDVEMSQVHIEENRAGNDFSSSGGGLALNLNGGTATIRQSHILNNLAALLLTELGGSSRGGGIYLRNGNLDLENVLLAGNAGERGDALSLHNNGQLSGTVTLNYVTLANNFQQEEDAFYAIHAEGGELYLRLNNTLLSGSPTAFRSPFSSQPISVTLANTLVDDDVSTLNVGQFEIVGEPLRGSAKYSNAAAGDYHLRTTSDAIDKGNSSPPEIDLDGNNRPKGTASDIGAYEFTPIVKAEQTISFAPLADKQLGDAALAISATASSGLAVSLSSDTPKICTMQNKLVTLLLAGTCTIRATQSGNELFNPALPVSQSFTVNNPGGNDERAIYLPLVIR